MGIKSSSHTVEDIFDTNHRPCLETPACIYQLHELGFVINKPENFNHLSVDDQFDHYIEYGERAIYKMDPSYFPPYVLAQIALKYNIPMSPYKRGILWYNLVVEGMYDDATDFGVIYPNTQYLRYLDPLRSQLGKYEGFESYMNQNKRFWHWDYPFPLQKNEYLEKNSNYW